MSKYIIEIAEEYEEYFKGVLICGIADGKFAVDVIAREDLEELNSDYINENFGELQDEAYQKGYEDGKKSTEKGCEGCRYVLKFADDDPCKNCSNCYTSKYAPMPKQNSPIKVGDEVINNTTGTKGILLEPETEDLLATVVVPNNRWNTFNISHTNLTKTGKHYDIASILEAMRT